MTTQLTIKEGIQAEFDAYMKTVTSRRLAVKRTAKVEAFETTFCYGQDELEVTPTLVDGDIFVTIAIGQWGSASGYHPYGSPETYSLEKGIEWLDQMKSSLGDTIYQPRYSGYQMGQVLDHIKSSLLSI